MSSIRAIALIKAGRAAGSTMDDFSAIRTYALAQAIGGGAKSIQNAVVTLAPTTLTYDGTQQEQVVSSVVLNGVTLTEGTDYTVTGNTATNAGQYTLTVTGAGEYTGAVTAQWTIAKAQGTISVSPSSLSISGVGETGTATITKTGDGAVSVGTSDSGVATASISSDTLTVTSAGEGSATVTVTMADGDNYLGASAQIGITVTPAVSANVFGVMWQYNDPSTALTRLTPANDPNHYVTVEIATEPMPAVGDGEGSSPFDSYSPWKDMDEYNIVNNDVSYRKGQSGFSRSVDTMVFIPGFYYKIVYDAINGRLYYYVSDGAIDGFSLHPGSNSYIGRYHTCDDSGYKSITGKAAITNITRATARTNSHSKGDNWWQWGVAQWEAVQLLYLVEFADFNSQSKIGNGRAYSSGTAQNSGGTDTMTYHTGRASGVEDQCAVQYRHIENLWGNYYNWLDGINFSGRKAYVCTDPSKFADDTTTNYTDAGRTLTSSGYITGLGMSSALPWLQLPTAAYNGSESTYVADRVDSASGWRVAYVAGYYSTKNPGSYGLFYLGGSTASSGAFLHTGSRLLYLP